MSLENVLERVASALESNNGNSAVADIIRQRDEAQNSLARLKREMDWLKQELEESRQRSFKKSRRVSALQGVITRMKRRAKA